MNKILKIILGVVLALIVVVSAVLSIVQEGRISPIPGGTVGNTAGNIRGNGLFCEYDGKVYFSNIYDNSTLYVMNPDGSDMKKLVNSSASYINAGGKYLFYYMQSVKGGTGLGYVRSTTGLYRCDLKGHNVTCLNGDLLTMQLLVGNQIYYQHYDKKNFSTFNVLSADGKYENMLRKGIVETACSDGYTLYYSGTEKDHYLYALNLATGGEDVVWQGNLCNPTVIGSYVYYMDIDHNYRLCRYDMDSDVIEVLTNDRLDFYNIRDGIIFYQRSGRSPALIRMNADGSNPETVAEGIYKNINMTSTFTYFYPYEDEGILFRTSTSGSLFLDHFPEAQDAALKNS